MGPKLDCVALLSRLLSHSGKGWWVLSQREGWREGRRVGQKLYPTVYMAMCAKFHHRTFLLTPQSLPS